MAIVGSLIRRGVQFRQWSRDGSVVNEILNLVAEAMTLIGSMTRHLMEGTEGVRIVVGWELLRQRSWREWFEKTGFMELSIHLG